MARGKLQGGSICNMQRNTALVDASEGQETKCFQKQQLVERMRLKTDGKSYGQLGIVTGMFRNDVDFQQEHHIGYACLSER